MSLPPQTLVLLALTPIIIWRIYSRIRRMVGRQTSSPRRQWLTICLFPLLAVLLGSVSASQPFALISLIGGVAFGALLGVMGHRLTKFEQTAEGLFYTPNAHLGIALSLMLVGRILYRFVGSGLLDTSAGVTPPNSPPTPLTWALFGMLAGYYVTYAVGLLLWRRAAALNGLQAAVTTEQC